MRRWVVEQDRNANPLVSTWENGNRLLDSTGHCLSISVMTMTSGWNDNEEYSLTIVVVAHAALGSIFALCPVGRG